MFKISKTLTQMNTIMLNNHSRLDNLKRAIVLHSNIAFKRMLGATSKLWKTHCWISHCQKVL